MRTILALVLKDIQLFWKDKMAFVLSFIMPMMLIVIFGLIFRGGGSPSGIRLLVVDEARSELSSKLIGFLEREDTFRVVTRHWISGEESVPMTRGIATDLLRNEAGTYRYALILPGNLVAEEFGLNFEMLYNPENVVENSIMQGILQKVLFTNAMPLLLETSDYGLSTEARKAFDSDMAGIISQHFGGDAEEITRQIESNGFWSMFSTDSDAADESGDGEGGLAGMGDSLGRIFSIEKTQVYGKDKDPAAQSVGGWAVMFVLFTLNGAASSLFEERDAGLFLRILSGPASRGHILVSKFCFCSLLGCAQMLVLFGFGHVLYGLFTSPAQIFPLIVISMATAAAATSFGMLLSSVVHTPAQANGLGTICILAMSAFGGAMFPLFMIPEFIRTFISPLSLVYWSMEGVLAVLWRDAGLLHSPEL